MKLTPPKYRILHAAFVALVLTFPFGAQTVEAQTPGMLDSSFAPPGVSGAPRNRSLMWSPDGILTNDGAMYRYARLNGSGGFASNFPAPSALQGENFAGQRRPLLIQPDGKIIEAKYFFSATISEDRLARANADGTEDASFVQGTKLADYRGQNNRSLGVTCAIWLPEGKFLVGGEMLQQFYADGSLDFQSTIGNGIVAIARQADRKLLVAYSSADYSDRCSVRRITENGAIDPSFYIKADSFIDDLVVQPDGKIIVAGRFRTLSRSSDGGTTFVETVSRTGIARVGGDGTFDAGFVPLLGHSDNYYSGEAQSTEIQDKFADFNGTTEDYIVHIKASVLRVALQADGKMIIFGLFDRWGLFANAYAVPSNLMRINADGSRDASFVAGVDKGAGVEYLAPSNSEADHRLPYTAWHDAGLALDGDGKVLIGGGFTLVNAVTRPLLARLHNGAAIQTITVADKTKVVWIRSGTAPELLSVTFDRSSDGGTTWLPMGIGSRIGTSSNWEIIGLNLASGQIRARGQTHRGGMVEQVQPYNFTQPNLVVEQPVGTPLPEGSPVQWDPVDVGATGATKTFRLKNPGDAALDFTFAGLPLGNSEFQITSSGNSNSIPAGGQRDITIVFHPTAKGLRQANLLLQTNAGTFTASLFGAGMVLPTVTSPTALAVEATTATLGGNVTDEGGIGVIERGVVSAETGMNNNPMIGGTGVQKVAAGTGAGIFTVGVSDLVISRGYSYKAYATNAKGTAYSSVSSFTTLAAPTQIVSNGTFELPALSSGWQYNPPVTSTQKWTFSGGSGVALNSYPGLGFGVGPYSNGQFAFLQSNGASVSQPVTFPRPGNYTMRWSIVGRDPSSGAGGNASFTVAISSATLGTVGSWPNDTISPGGFVGYGMLINVVTPGTYTLTFTNTTPVASGD